MFTFHYVKNGEWCFQFIRFNFTSDFCQGLFGVKLEFNSYTKNQHRNKRSPTKSLPSIHLFVTPLLTIK